MAINNTLYTGSSVSISTTEISLTSGTSSIQTQTTACVAQVWLETVNISAGDEFEIALLEKVRASGDTQRRIVLANLVGAQTDLLWISDPFQVGIGWDFSIKKISGTDRTFSWSIRAIT